MRTKSTNSKLTKNVRKRNNSVKNLRPFLSKIVMLDNMPRNSAPVREEKIQKAKKRVATGFYSSPRVTTLVAERIIQDLKYIKAT